MSITYAIALIIAVSVPGQIIWWNGSSSTSIAFAGTNQASLVRAIQSSEPPAISKIQPLAPASLDRVVGACLAKDPEDRWQNAGDVGKELKWLAEGSGAGAVTVPGCSACVSRTEYPYGLKCESRKSGSDKDCEEAPAGSPYYHTGYWYGPRWSGSSYAGRGIHSISSVSVSRGGFGHFGSPTK